MVHEVETDVIDGTLKLTLEATTGRSLISGIELIRNP
jgi:hypothetical protein